MSKDPNSVDPGLEADLGCQSVGQAPRGNNAFTDEVSGLHSELAKDSVKSRSASHRVSIVPGINIKDPQVDQVQRLINARRPNALPLVIDGDYGPLTRAALTQCDCVKRPPPYGGPDKATLYSLLKGEVNDQKRSVRTEDLTSTKLSVWSLTLEERFVQTLHLVLPKLPMELEGAVKDMLCADAIAMIAGVMVVWSGSHVFGVGAARGFEVLDVGNNLNDYLSMTSAAETQEHLSHASSHLVDIIVKLETEVFLAEVTKASGRISGAARKEPDVQLKPQDRKTDGLDEIGVGKVESEGEDGYDAEGVVVPNRAGELSSASTYTSLVSSFKNSSVKDVEEFYSGMDNLSVDYKGLVDDAVKKYGMTPDEGHAVFGYTTKLFYRDLNAVIGSGDSSPQATELASLISSGMNKMPSAGPVQYRGLRLDSSQVQGFDSQFSIGNTVESSFWSTGPNPLDAYQGQRNLVIHTDAAKDISDLAFGVNFHDKVGKPMYSSETLIPPGVKFKVMGVDNRGRTILVQQ